MVVHPVVVAMLIIMVEWNHCHPNRGIIHLDPVRWVDLVGGVDPEVLIDTVLVVGIVIEDRVVEDDTKMITLVVVVDSVVHREEYVREVDQ